MVKLIDRPLDQVSIGRSGRPHRFAWSGRSFVVNRTTEVWKDTGRWWEGEGEKTFFRLETVGGQLVELYRDHQSGVWFIYRVYD